MGQEQVVGVGGSGSLPIDAEVVGRLEVVDIFMCVFIFLG